MKTKKRILVIIKGELESAVPIISISHALAGLNHRVSIACGSCGENLIRELNEHGISVEEVGRRLKNRFYTPALKKILEWAAFRRGVISLLHRRPDFQLFYIGSADTAISLTGIFSPRSYVLHLRELHDREPHYILALRQIARNARQVVVPEINRAYIYKALLALDSLPIIIPNKPHSHPRKRNLDISFLPGHLRERIANSKCILYQGQIHPERNLSAVLEAVSSTGLSMIIMGKDFGPLSMYRQILPTLIHVPFVDPPGHLHVTSWATIGLITYDNNSLNTVYCAPNKVWEYAGFGVPMLCSDNLGLRYSVGLSGAANVTNLNDKDEAEAAIRVIERDYDEMARCALEFFDSVDNSLAINSIV